MVFLLRIAFRRNGILGRAAGRIRSGRSRGGLRRRSGRVGDRGPLSFFPGRHIGLGCLRPLLNGICRGGKSYGSTAYHNQGGARYPCRPFLKPFVHLSESSSKIIHAHNHIRPCIILRRRPPALIRRRPPLCPGPIKKTARKRDSTCPLSYSNSRGFAVFDILCSLYQYPRDNATAQACRNKRFRNIFVNKSLFF